MGPTAAACAGRAEFLRDIAQALAAIAETFGQTVALDMLYVYALKRPIDGSGLSYRLERLKEPGNTLAQDVAEVFGSDEFRETNAMGHLSPLTVLTAWVEAAQAFPVR
jgi:hypothetical protein